MSGLRDQSVFEQNKDRAEESRGCAAFQGAKGKVGDRDEADAHAGRYEAHEFVGDVVGVYHSYFIELERAYDKKISTEGVCVGVALDAPVYPPIQAARVMRSLASGGCTST